MRLSGKVGEQTFLNVRVKQGTFRNQRVDPLLSNLPGDSVNEQGILDGVELTQHGVQLDFLSVQDLHIDVNQPVHLLDRQQVKMFMKVE